MWTLHLDLFYKMAVLGFTHPFQVKCLLKIFGGFGFFVPILRVCRLVGKKNRYTAGEK